MFLLEWYRQYKEIRRDNDRENELIETLKHEIEMLRIERDTLLSHALGRNEKSPVVNEPQEFKPIPANRLPWNARRQLLEREDREAARLLADKRKETVTPVQVNNRAVETITVSELEEAMDIAAEERKV